MSVDLENKVVEFLFNESSKPMETARTKVKGIVVPGEFEGFIYLKQVIEHYPLSPGPHFIGGNKYAKRDISNLQVFDMIPEEYQRTINEAYEKRDNLMPPICFSLWNPDGSLVR